MKKIFTFLVCSLLVNVLSSQDNSLECFWKLSETPEYGIWILVDTLELEKYSPQDSWEETTKYVKSEDTQTDKCSKPGSIIYYQERINLRTGEFWSRKLTYSWYLVKDSLYLPVYYSPKIKLRQ